jgi:hypothetical protein
MTVHYRVRKGFRIAAAVPAFVLTPLGVLFLGLGLLNVLKGEPISLVAIVLGAFGVGIGLLFARTVWTGRVPASVEEYGLDDLAEVEEHREEARAKGLLDEEPPSH